MYTPASRVMQSCTAHWGCTAAQAEYASGHVIPHIQVLKDGANKDIAKELKAAVDNIPTAHAEPALAECRAIVMKVMSVSLN